MLGWVKRITTSLPPSWQQELKRLYFRRQIRREQFVSDEAEFTDLDQYVSEGALVLDIGANVGHYTKRLSELVGATGRVIALEPVPATFALLVANASLFKHQNVTLINAAASSENGIVNMSLPIHNGSVNFYQAAISDGGGVQVMALALDSIHIGRVAFVKMDVEGHEAEAIEGMKETLERDRPTLLVETFSTRGAIQRLTDMGYMGTHATGSPNWIFRR